MEIGPIPGVRDFTAIKAPAADFQLSTVIDIEAVARPDHSARAAARKKAAGAEDLEADDPELDREDADSPEDAPQSHISYFA